MMNETHITRQCEIDDVLSRHWIKRVRIDGSDRYLTVAQLLALQEQRRGVLEKDPIETQILMPSAKASEKSMDKMDDEELKKPRINGSHNVITRVTPAVQSLVQVATTPEGTAWKTDP